MNNAIIAVVDQEGDILGVKVESGVSVSLQGQPNTPANDLAALVFSIDGAVAEARSAAFFSSDQGPLTSRTVGFVSQSTITQREVQSDPDLGNSASVYQGPGVVARIGVGGNFPINALNTPSADLFGIEFTNRDTNLDFNVPSADLTSADISSTQIINTESYGVASGLLPTAQPRGIGTLPGGIPLYKNGQLVGGIGVFFPGPYGYADYEQNFTPLPANASPTAEQNAEIARMDTPLELTAEWMAFAATNGSTGDNFTVGSLHSSSGPTIPTVPGYNFPGGPSTEIDMAGIILDELGPGGPYLGPLRDPCGRVSRRRRKCRQQFVAGRIQSVEPARGRLRRVVPERPDFGQRLVGDAARHRHANRTGNSDRQCGNRPSQSDPLGNPSTGKHRRDGVRRDRHQRKRAGSVSHAGCADLLDRRGGGQSPKRCLLRLAGTSAGGRGQRKHVGDRKGSRR